MRIRIVRQYDVTVRAVGDLTQRNWERYCGQHGYALETRYYSEPIFEANRMKLKAMRDAINPVDDFDMLFWADADAVVTKREVKLESFLDFESQLRFDVSQYGLSTGNFFVKNNIIARNLLDICVFLGNVTEEVNRQYASLLPHEAGDESTLKHLIAAFPNFARHISTVKMADFPSTHTKESFILHAARRSNEERIALLSPYCS